MPCLIKLLDVLISIIILIAKKLANKIQAINKIESINIAFRIEFVNMYNKCTTNNLITKLGSTFFYTIYTNNILNTYISGN